MAGSIQKVGKKWRVTLELGVDNAGKRLRKYVSVSTESEAKKILNEFEYNRQRNLLVHSEEMTLADLLHHFMENYVRYNCEETTAYGYRNIIYNHIIPFMGNIELQKLQPIHIQNYYRHLMEEKGLSPNTVHKHHANLRKALDYALKLQFVYRNAADAVSMPRKVRFEGKAYSKEQLKELLEKVKDTKLELPVYLAGYLGLRREEITGLKWENVDLDQRILHIREVRTSAGEKVITKAPKTEKSKRSLYIVDELYKILIKHRKLQEQHKELLGDSYQYTGYVFVREDGRPYRVNSVTEWFKDFLEKNNLPKCRLHDLRHSFVSVLYASGVDLKAISEAVGHSDIGTTSRIYTHLLDKTHKNTVSAMSDALRD
ncbi:site-specific integrase [Cohnella massiliensis]|uniref:site-specific integrase n=1 Tax=Cohnella massiliensis TaxID=1816691 RepID=UPI0009BB5D80|nr:site-specific integrase [Cohnella massiliensis]